MTELKKRMTNLLSCYFPTTLVIVDDDQKFIDELTKLVDGEDITIRSFTDPVKALNYINNESSINRLDFLKLAREGEDDTPDWHSIMINLNELHDEIYSFNRFNQISVVIADYSMPEMNGVDLCSKIIDPNVQKILMTGIGDGKIAIDAFNDGYINQFVKKDYPDFGEETMNCLHKSLIKYFKQYTDSVDNYLSVHGNNYLKDPAFMVFFQSACLSSDYIEYYMLDCFGSYLFLNKNGKAILLSVLPESEMQKIVEIGMDSGEIDPYVLECLQTRQYMLAVHNKDGMLPPIKDWGNYLQIARNITGYQTYYFSVIDSDYLDVKFEQIKTYEDFCSQRYK